jgi:hypothetical protein
VRHFINVEIFNQFKENTECWPQWQWGDPYINNYHHLVASELKLPLGQNTWFHGRPVMVFTKQLASLGSLMVILVLLADQR